MAFHMQRSRSAMSIHRPLSRASTQSAHSPAPDLVPDNKHYANNNFMHHQMMGMQYANPQQNSHMDMMQMPQAQHPQQHQYQMQPQQYHDPTQQFIQDNSYMPVMPGDTNYPMPHQMMQYTPQLNGSEPEDKRRKGASSATATNDKELRELLNKNEGRALPEVAQEVIAKERTPQAEKTKQLFAMLWYISPLY